VVVCLFFSCCSRVLLAAAAARPDGYPGGSRRCPGFPRTFVTCLYCKPIYGARGRKLPRLWFTSPASTSSFVANLARFVLLLLTLTFRRHRVRGFFFVWVASFNFFAVAVFCPCGYLSPVDHVSSFSVHSGRRARLRPVGGPLIPIGFSVQFVRPTLLLVAILFLSRSWSFSAGLGSSAASRAARGNSATCGSIVR